MKYDKIKDTIAENNTEQQNKITLNHFTEIKTESKHPEDIFQVELYNSGSKLLEKLEKIEGPKEKALKSFEELKEYLIQLKDFVFDIGFAGGMSSGKSTVINSLIEYPLMPTCKLTTTCVGTHIFYGEKPKLCVVDDDTKKRVLDIDCSNISQTHFEKLKDYACVVTHLKVVENLQYFTNHNIFQDKDSLTPQMLQMNKDNPNHVIILLMILLTVYVDQNSQEQSHKALEANRKRKEILKFFHFPIDTVNYTIQLQWNGDFLKSGMTITDLPGLGAYAPDKDMGKGKTLKGHDSISTDAIKKTDAMVFLVDPQVNGAGVPALQVMMSNAQLKEVVNRNDLIIPILNKIDDCKGQQSLIDQAVGKFLNILKDTGVNKTADDIHLYSAWYGEYKFADFPIEKTCFYHMNVEQERKSQKSMLKNMPMFKNMTELQINELVEQTLGEKIKTDLEENYKNSGIDELKTFFRTAYIRKSKNRRSQATILAVRKLALNLIIPMENLLKNLDTLHNVAGEAIEDISKGLKTSVDVPIADALERSTGKYCATGIVQDLLDMIPQYYISAFKGALEEYKKKNIEICKKFEPWNAFANKARIDKLGSNNQRNYEKLCEEIKVLSIDVKYVNKKFNVVLNHVVSETEEMYNSALLVMKKLKTSISKSLNQYEQGYKKNVSENDPVLKSVTALKTTVIGFMEHQIDLIIDSMKVNKTNLAKAGNDTVAQMLSLNTNMINMYTKSVLDEVNSKLTKGCFFINREFLQVTGDGGILETFENLNLSSKDKDYIESEVRTIGISAISNNLGIWYQSTENAINENFIELRKQLFGMMDNTVNELKNNSGNIQELKERLEETLDSVKKVFIEFRDGVDIPGCTEKVGGIQPLYEESLSDVNDEMLNKYVKNIFCEIIDLAGEESR